MQVAKLLKTSGFVAVCLIGWAFSAQADVIYPISASASSSYPTYGAQFAIDTGPNTTVTDWASNGQGIGSTLNRTLGRSIPLQAPT
jgi:hypothetical protein